ncbi:DUF4232 domain-containing protein [Streptomyces catenulae]|uniref:DUF4232 domain-containing protein n=1 Tax=Streptomyces catenulae TaxID=66875 RepID=A0ABV2YS88_9ACTN|nr:DUF4232 domain-containing protein [Streptomyces catenulae]
MRAHTLSLAGLALVAGLTLTACDGGDGATASDQPSSSAQGSGDAAQNGGDSAAPADKGSTSGGSGSASGGSGGGAGAGAGAGGACKTAQLDFSLSHGMSENTYLINLKNTGSAACSLQGFPGVDLKGKDGTVSADRSSLTPAKVTVQPGEETRFTLHAPANTSGGSGVTFTSLIVTPPNETHSHSLPAAINLAVSDKPTGDITVDPVGAGK